MYIKDRFHQLGLADFNQPIGLKINPENRWVKKIYNIDTVNRLNNNPVQLLIDKDNLYIATIA